MANTHYSGPIVSAAGFTGDVTGDITGDITGDVTGYVTKNVETVAATSTGAAIADDTDFVNITSAGANNIVILPGPVQGKVVRGAIGGTGCEITASDANDVSINGTTGTAVEAALAADASFEAVCVQDDAWILLHFSSTGTITSPDPD